MRKVYLLGLAGLLLGCVNKPAGIEPVRNFEPDRYLGTWHEIARLEHSFERGLQQVTADYSRRQDGGLKVINRGYNVETNEWEEAEGRAYFVESPELAYLKVSFFGPFYGAYVVFELDKEDYQYAFVTGNTRSYLWFLSRTPQVSDELRRHFIERADALGFDTGELIFVEHGWEDVKREM